MWAVRPAARAELPDLTPTQCIALALARHVQVEIWGEMGRCGEV